MINIVGIYDNGGKTLDRYTIVTDLKSDLIHNDCISASEVDVISVFTWSSCKVGAHLGKKIRFEDLSVKLQDKITNEIFLA